MKKFIEILKANPNGVLATQDGNKVKTRVFQFLFAEENKVYFCTSNEKPVFKQLQANPNVSFCIYAANFSPVLSVNGKAVFTNNIALKTRALDENPMIKGYYGGPENPILELFYIETEEVVTFSFTEGEKTVRF
jgi:uncharacterized pyridoxamine 5'-phosphate oxidase family protein